MDRRAVEITLEDPVIASVAVATASAPASLPYLPGAMLWGLLAGAAYRSGERNDVILSRLHGGGLMIGDAWPISGADVALPMPKSLHKPKDGGVWQDWSDGTHKPNHKQAKEGQVGPSAGLKDIAEIRVAMIKSRRTAINPYTLTAAEGQFYGLEALAAGQRFLALIDGQEAEKAVEALTGPCFLGRSRNAEYGRATIREFDVPPLPPCGEGSARYLWCLSDLAAHDAFYLPTERPDTLFGQTIEWEKSFVRHRHYSPFNSQWKRRQPERLVIERGSVLVLKTGIEPGLQRAGFWQEQGLGMLLACTQKPLDALKGWHATCAAFAEHLASREPTQLSSWLEARAKTAEQRAMESGKAAKAWDEWRSCYEAARRCQGEVCGPTPSQWAALADMGSDGLREFLTRVLEASGAKETLTWQARFASGQEGTFAGKALAILGDDGRGAAELNRTAKVLRDTLKREGWFDGR